MFEFGSFAAIVVTGLAIVAAMIVAMIIAEKPEQHTLQLLERCPSCGDGMNYIDIEDKCYACGRRMG